MNKQHMIKLMAALTSMKGDILRLPLPRRAELEPVMQVRKYYLGRLWDDMVDYCSRDLFSHEVLVCLSERPDLEAFMRERGVDRASLTSNIIIMRHWLRKAPIMTVSEPLSRLLDDTNINDNVPSRFLVLPHKTVYLEFEPAERREFAMGRVVATGIDSICEGCYLHEREYANLNHIAAETAQLLGLDRHKAGRAIEIGFTASPFANNQMGGIM